MSGISYNYLVIASRLTTTVQFLVALISDHSFLSEMSKNLKKKKQAGILNCKFLSYCIAFTGNVAIALYVRFSHLDYGSLDLRPTSQKNTRKNALKK